MTEQQLDALVAFVAGGSGVESGVASMGLNSDVEMDFLKKHPNARTRIKEAKQQAKVSAQRIEA